MSSNPAAGYAPLNGVSFYTNGADPLGTYGRPLVSTGDVQTGETRNEFLAPGNHEKILKDCQSVPKLTPLGHISASKPLQQIMEEPNSIVYYSASYCGPIAGNTETGITNSDRRTVVDYGGMFPVRQTFPYPAPTPAATGSAADKHSLALAASKHPHVPQAPNQTIIPPSCDYYPYIPAEDQDLAAYTGPVRAATQRPRQRIYDRPGKKPGASYQSDTAKLAATHERGGGTSSAVAWIHKAFKKGVTLPALVRFLTSEELNELGFTGGFTPAQMYDGFLEKTGERFECGLCGEAKRANWKNKKDSIRHFQKFHFGLAESCGKCEKLLYSSTEKKKHVCHSAVVTRR